MPDNRSHPDLGVFHGIGGAYYPEHHPRASWPRYAEMMEQAGLSFCRLAEFTWDKLEPQEGEFDFSWLDEVMGQLDDRGIRVILCTPTAVPPLWACERYPELHPMDESGKTIGFGVRRYTCPTSRVYHQLCRDIVTAMAHRYAQHPQVLGWQIDNEVGHPFCFCPRCRRHFQQWCAQRYGTIAQFNDALCTHFLGQTFTDFTQLPLPPSYPHPNMWLIYHQFFSEKTIDCFHQQARTLRDEGVTVPITTNMMPTWYGYDHEQMATALDVVAVDHYGLQDKTLFGPDYLHELFTHAYSRGIKGGQNIWFLEFQWGRTGNLPLPGEVRWEALTQVGFGADLLNFFRVDTCPSGLERDGFGLLGANGQPGRVFREMQTLSDELRRLKPLLDNTTAQRAEVALLFTHDNHCDFARNSKHPSFQGPSGNGYSMHLSRHFQAIARQNIPCDIVYPRGDFSAYKVIVAPALYILPQPLAEKLIRFVANGGKLVLTSLSGIADENGRMWELPAPGPLGAIAGVEITDYGQYYAKAGPVSLVSATPAFDFPPLPAVQWIDEIIPVAPQVEVLARFDNPFYAHAAAITRHPYQAGHVYCLGAILDQQGYNQLYRALAADLDLSPLLALPEGVYVSVRRKDEREIYFINNPGIEPREIELPGEFHNLLADTTISGRQTLPPFGVQVMSPVDER